MTGFNMPPGCSPNDIPGNRPEDEAWERFHCMIDNQCDEMGWDVDDAIFFWNIAMNIAGSVLEYGRTRYIEGFHDGKERQT